jgi:cellulose synthase A
VGGPWEAGSPRVDGDEEEEEVDDLENEFNFIELNNPRDKQQDTETTLHGHASFERRNERRDDHHVVIMSHLQPQFPLLTNDQMVSTLLLKNQRHRNIFQ